MSKAGLKKALKEMSKEEIIETVCELYDARREAKDYLDYWISPQPLNILEKYKEDIDKMFFYSTGKNRKQPAVSELKRMEKYFTSLVYDSEKSVELAIHIADRQFQWAKQKNSGIMQTEKAVRRALDNARIKMEEAALEDLFALRIERLGENIDEFYSQPHDSHRGWWRKRRW
ncbi:MAG: hypothetical protein HDS12_06860 [Bacteroides sp.]|nr:hypothetical protein [Bacteroides sp.]